MLREPHERRHLGELDHVLPVARPRRDREEQRAVAGLDPLVLVAAVRRRRPGGERHSTEQEQRRDPEQRDASGGRDRERERAERDLGRDDTGAGAGLARRERADALAALEARLGGIAGVEGEPSRDGGVDFSPRASPGPEPVSSRPRSRSARSHSSVPTARRLSLLGIAALLLLGGVALASGRRREDDDEHERILARYGPLLLPVSSRTGDWEHVIELAEMPALVRLAEHQGKLILQLGDGNDRAYVVEDGSTAYRYSVHAPEPVTALVWPPARDLRARQ